jgi:hypothetical protein
MIITLDSCGRGFSPLSNINIKLASFVVLARKERKEDVYQSQQRSTDLCTDFYIHSTQVSVCDGY